MSKKIWLILVMIMASFFMPNVYAEEAEEENYYELKLYEKESVNDFSDAENSVMTFLLEKGLLRDSYNEIKDEIYDSNNKLLFTTYVDDYSVVVNDELTIDDNIEYIFTADEKADFEEEGFNYDGIKLLLSKDEPCNSVCIEKVELDSKSDTTKILSDAKKKGLNIKFDVMFRKVNDFAKYKIVVNNMTDEDYVIDEENSFDDSKYISYEYDYEDDNNVAPKNSKKVMYVTLKYKQQVPEDKFSNGFFTEKNNMSINLDNNKNSGILENPNTGYSLFIVGIILLVVVVLTIVVYKKTNNKKYLGIIILSLVLLPVGIYAMGKFQISVESDIRIPSGKVEKVSFFHIGLCTDSYDYYEMTRNPKEYDYEIGMTWGEWAESKYNVDFIKLFSNQSVNTKMDFSGSNSRHWYMSSRLLDCLKTAETNEDLSSCENQFRKTRFSSSDLISSDGMYYLCYYAI